MYVSFALQRNSATIQCLFGFVQICKKNLFPMIVPIQFDNVKFKKTLKISTVVYLRQKILSRQQCCLFIFCLKVCICIRESSRFFVQVGHEDHMRIYWKYTFTISGHHHQTYQNYDKSRQKLGIFLENKVLKKKRI